MGMLGREKVDRCPVCESNSIRDWGLRIRRFVPIVLSQCSCGLWFQNFRMTEECAAKFYREGIYRGEDEFRRADASFQRGVRRGKSIKQFVVKYLGHVPRSVIEYGCGFGGILRAFYNESEVMGIDLDERALAFARAKGIETTRHVCFEGYELIVISHVLEHLYNVNHVLSQMSEELLDTGSVYVEVPLVEASERPKGRNVQAGHLWYFNRHSLIRLFARHGFVLRSDVSENAFLFDKSSIVS